MKPRVLPAPITLPLPTENIDSRTPLLIPLVMPLLATETVLATTESAVSISLTSRVPLALNPASVSPNTAASLFPVPTVTTGTSLPPATVTTTVAVALPSILITVKLSLTTWPIAKVCTFG